jgi:hypothetical protein
MEASSVTERKHGREETREREGKRGWRRGILGHLQEVDSVARAGKQEVASVASRDSHAAAPYPQRGTQPAVCKKPPRHWGFFWNVENSPSFATFDDLNLTKHFGKSSGAFMLTSRTPNCFYFKIPKYLNSKCNCLNIV